MEITVKGNDKRIKQLRRELRFKKGLDIVEKKDVKKRTRRTKKEIEESKR